MGGVSHKKGARQKENEGVWAEIGKLPQTRGWKYLLLHWQTVTVRLHSLNVSQRQWLNVFRAAIKPLFTDISLATNIYSHIRSQDALLSVYWLFKLPRYDTACHYSILTLGISARVLRPEFMDRASGDDNQTDVCV